MPSRQFIEGRRRHLAQIREDSEKSLALMVRFLQAVQGDVSSKELYHLFRDHGIAYPGRLYPTARKKAKVGEKPINRRLGSRARLHRLQEPFDNLLLHTPEEELPTVHEEKKQLELTPPTVPYVPVLPSDAPPAVQHEMEKNRQALMASSLKGMPVDLIIAELERRGKEAEELLQKLKKVGIKTSAEDK